MVLWLHSLWKDIHASSKPLYHNTVTQLSASLLSIFLHEREREATPSILRWGVFSLPDPAIHGRGGYSHSIPCNPLIFSRHVCIHMKKSSNGDILMKEVHSISSLSPWRVYTFIQWHNNYSSSSIVYSVMESWHSLFLPLPPPTSFPTPTLGALPAQLNIQSRERSSPM